MLDGAITARYRDREETAHSGSALIIPPGEQFTLLAIDRPAEAVCVMRSDGQAITDTGTFTPPWAR